MPHIGPMELILVLVLALMVLGPGRLPNAGRSLGRSMREFKDSLSGGPGERATELEDDGTRRDRCRRSP